MKPRDRDKLEEILKVAREIIEVTDGKERSDLDRDIMLKRTLERCIEIMGEAANVLSEDVKLEHSDIDWQKIIGMRNRLVHEYFEVDYDIIWDASQDKVPGLISYLEHILEEE